MLSTAKDCLYSYIKFGPLCKAYYNTPEVQRMGQVHQLGIARKVFPSANHTRLEHSLGVMHLAGEVCKKLGIKGRAKELIQLAGLLHDIGHLPYSHLFDDFLKYVEENNLVTENMKNIPCNHEERSVLIVKQISARLGILTEEEVQFVIDCINGVVGTLYPKYYYQIVNSKIDVDKLDYLQRDAYHTGVMKFIPDYIIRCMYVDEEDNLRISDKGQTDVNTMFYTRETMHKCVYQNKKCLLYSTIYLGMLIDVREDIDFTDLWENDIESLLRKHPKTKDTYELMLQCILIPKNNYPVKYFHL